MSREITLKYMPLILGAGVMLALLLGLPGRRLHAEGESRVSEICLSCHEGQDTTMVGTAHWAGDVHDGAGARIACTDCHAGSSKHYEEDPEAYPMTNPAKVTPAAEARICTACHENTHQQNMIEKNVHAMNDISCSRCHSVHGSKQYSLLRKPENELCLSCHPKVAGEFAKPYRHPVAEGVMQCTECHMTLDRTSRDLSNNGTNVCLKCHGEFSGPFPYEHEATLDHSTEEGGCLTCHNPHGSSQPRMLKQPYSPPHYQLCTQCHGIPPGHLSNFNHGTRWATVPCNDCHSDIHGSYDNRLFMNESYRAQGCLNPACHGR